MPKSSHRNFEADSGTPARWQGFTLATGLTFTRLLLILSFAVILALRGPPALALALCGASVFLDAVDGWVARRFRQQSPLGEFADPVVDKITVAILYGAIAIATQSIWVWMAVLAIVARDVFVTALRIRCLRRGGRLAVNPLAKSKTAAQFIVGVGLVSAAFLFGADLASSWPVVLLLLTGILALTYFSAIRYLGGSWLR